LDTFDTPEAVEQLRRSIAMLTVGQVASIDRDRALRLLEELQRLQSEHRMVTTQLHGLLDRLEHPSARR
jgi:hypothetical protein